MTLVASSNIQNWCRETALNTGPYAGGKTRWPFLRLKSFGPRSRRRSRGGQRSDAGLDAPWTTARIRTPTAIGALESGPRIAIRSAISSLGINVTLLFCSPTALCMRKREERKFACPNSSNPEEKKRYGLF